MYGVPAESKRGQQQDHEDQEGVTLVHGGPILTGSEGGWGGWVNRQHTGHKLRETHIRIRKEDTVHRD